MWENNNIKKMQREVGVIEEEHEQFWSQSPEYRLGAIWY